MVRVIAVDAVFDGRNPLRVGLIKGRSSSGGSSSFKSSLVGGGLTLGVPIAFRDADGVDVALGDGDGVDVAPGDGDGVERIAMDEDDIQPMTGNGDGLDATTGDGIDDVKLSLRDNTLISYRFFPFITYFPLFPLGDGGRGGSQPPDDIS